AFEVALAAIHRVAGFSGIVIAKTLVLGATFAAVHVLCRRRGAGAGSAMVVLAVAAFVMRERFVERPHVVSFAGEAIVLWALADLRGPWPWPRWVAFAVAMVAWANAHAGIFVAPAALVLAALGWLRRDRAVAGRALGLAAIAGAAAVATPLGFGIFRYWMLHVRIPRIHAVDEFRSATWRSDAPFLAWTIVLGVALLGAWWTGRRRRGRDQGEERASAAGGRTERAELTAADVLPAAAMVALGCVSIRFSADAVLMTAPVLLRAGSIALGRSLFESEGDLGTLRPRWGALTAALALLALTVVPRVKHALTGHPLVELGLAPDLLPLGAIGFVEKLGLRERMYNDFELGSYLALEGYPRYRVFVDPRLPAYPEEFHALLGRFDLTREEWDTAMSRFGVDSALLTYAGVNRRVAWWDPRHFALVYRQEDARVFVRRLPRWSALIAEREIPATFTFSVEEGTATVPLEEQPVGSPVPPCEWQRRLGDLWFELDGNGGIRAERAYRRALAQPGCLPSAADETRLSVWLGALDASAGRIDSAISLLSRALARSPDDVRARAARARALLAAGRLREAAADWTAVATGATDTDLKAI
ncbi:MAG TPA: tetratricopeptide repeat protein, partial [Polyangia bacterium]|nr:tetratricopeptide repeat protein [Polyangia bacterium]